LVDGGDNVGFLEQDLKVLNAKVGNSAHTVSAPTMQDSRKTRNVPDGSDLARIQQLFHILPRLHKRR
jgi:hypothetical protein